MLSKVKSCGLSGIDGYIVDVEADISNGIPTFDLVGLGDTAVKESRERVRAAVRNSGFEFPVRRIVINLAPAHKKKGGSSFDLPITVGILTATDYIKAGRIKDYVFIGELSLDGELKPVKGILPMIIGARNAGIKKAVVPFANADEAAVVKEVKVFPASNVNEIIGHLNGNKDIKRHMLCFYRI